MKWHLFYYYFIIRLRFSPQGSKHGMQTTPGRGRDQLRLAIIAARNDAAAQNVPFDEVRYLSSVT